MEITRVKPFKPIESWISMVAYSHSSRDTAEEYKRWIDAFFHYIGKNPQQIIEECESTKERDFRRRYAMYLQSFIGTQRNSGYASGSVKVMVSVIKSFFKYNDLPLGHVPIPRDTITYHNRDITKEEIALILNISNSRDRAFFLMMAQSGLRPNTLCKLQLKDMELDRLKKEECPVKIHIPKEKAKGKYRAYFTFIAEESVKYLKAYFSTRQNLTSESYVFTVHGHEDPITRRTMSNRFRARLRTLKAKGLIHFEESPKGKPNPLRLYNLRKFFRKYANQAGFEFVQFWMGHIVKTGQEEHYRPTDVEFHRELYKENAMPFLRVEKETPSETEKIVQEQAARISNLEKKINQRDEQLKDVSLTLEKLKPLMGFINGFESEEKLKKFLDLLKEASVISFPEADTVLHRINISEEEKEKLTSAAETLGVSEDDFIKASVKAYIKHGKKKQKAKNRKV